MVSAKVLDALLDICNGFSMKPATQLGLEGLEGLQWEISMIQQMEVPKGTIFQAIEIGGIYPEIKL